MCFNMWITKIIVKLFMHYLNLLMLYKDFHKIAFISDKIAKRRLYLESCDVIIFFIYSWNYRHKAASVLKIIASINNMFYVC